MWWWLACAEPSDDAPRPTDGATDRPTAETSDTGSTGRHSGGPFPPRDNVLIVLADDLSPEFVGAYGEGDQDVRTPNLDAWAAQGMLFRNAWSYPECSPGRSAMQTGRHARRTGIGANNELEDLVPFQVPPTETSLAEMLRVAERPRYATAYFGKWHLQEPLGGLPGARLEGWGYFSGTWGNLYQELYPELGTGNYYVWNKQDNTGWIFPMIDVYVTTDVAADTIAWLGKAQEPWVVQVSLHAPHPPRHVPPDDLHTFDPMPEEPTLQQKHLAMVESMDTVFAQLLAALPNDVRERTNIVFLGDNGSDWEALGSAPGTGKLSLFDSGVRVPLIVQGPWVGRPGSESPALVSIVDLFPTLAEAAQIPSTILPPLDGQSLLPALADPSLPVHETLWSERFDPPGFGPYVLDKVTVRDQRYKLLRDRIAGTDRFFEYVEGADNEGFDLLLGGPLTSDQQAAYERLGVLVEERVATMTAGRSAER